MEKWRLLVSFMQAKSLSERSNELVAFPYGFRCRIREASSFGEGLGNISLR